MERIENWAGVGFPDVFVNADGLFFLIELKTAKHNSVLIRPHQVAFHIRHRNALTWILVRKRKKKQTDVILYAGKDIQALAEDGLETDPILRFDASNSWAPLFEKMIVKQ